MKIRFNEPPFTIRSRFELRYFATQTRNPYRPSIVWIFLRFLISDTKKRLLILAKIVAATLRPIYVHTSSSFSITSRRNFFLTVPIKKNNIRDKYRNNSARERDENEKNSKKSLEIEGKSGERIEIKGAARAA